MPHTLLLRPLSTLALILAALLAVPALATEEEAQAQGRIEQRADAQQDEGERNGAEGGANGDEAQGEKMGAEENPEGHDEHVVEPEEDEHADNPAVQAYREIAERMHRDMLTEFSGNADVDFARGMVAHHQGALDMARVALEHGEDPAVRDLAREVIETQEEEIAFLQDWLARHGHDEATD
ncbi:DUF305 domain-containing protein [Billgrantia diversa]|uniref:CopM family metallochaperone n=1 Tax=Halomonas sp. MCCC 1A13316 TaxID=2733487 RepID=UPI0018A4E9AE|nr:DUF305 domain-containing protein [Halomonas sp. MCCC 1A13316]QOR40068.1 DUF305 domain-containing protein [Halomonas sp. MCCC 1A13316]